LHYRKYWLELDNISIEANLEKLAIAETWNNGKAVRETLAADIPLTIDHFRYFGSHPFRSLRNCE